MIENITRPRANKLQSIFVVISKVIKAKTGSMEGSMLPTLAKVAVMFGNTVYGILYLDTAVRLIVPWEGS